MDSGGKDPNAQKKETKKTNQKKGKKHITPKNVWRRRRRILKKKRKSELIQQKTEGNPTHTAEKKKKVTSRTGPELGKFPRGGPEKASSESTTPAGIGHRGEIINKPWPGMEGGQKSTQKTLEGRKI